jgi:hypothetical protein
VRRQFYLADAADGRDRGGNGRKRNGSAAEWHKTMIIRGAAGRKLPYGKVQPGDALYIVKNDGKGMIEARGVVDSVLNSDKMTPEASAALVNGHQAQLLLTEKQLTRLSGSGTTAPTLDEEV